MISLWAIAILALACIALLLYGFYDEDREFKQLKEAKGKSPKKHLNF